MNRTVCRSFAWLAVACLPFLAHAEDTPNKPDSASKRLNVLFIGNSYTQYNNLPAMLETMAASSESLRQIQTKAVTFGGGTLQVLWERGAALEAIQEQKWDFVVLQEQSMRPIQNPELMYKYARLFDAEIKKNGARTILFLTWASHKQPDMQVLLDRAYITLAKELGAQVAPVGPAWQAALRLNPKIPLYRDDRRHPAPTGTYLAACVFYAVLLDSQQPCPTIRNAELSSKYTGRADEPSPEYAVIARSAASKVSGAAH
jgi:hypothetical protein